MIFQASSHFSVSTAGLTEGVFAESRFEVDVEVAVNPDSLFSVTTISSGFLGLAAPSGVQEAWLGLTHSGTDRFEKEFATDEPFRVGLAAEGPDFSFATHAFSGDELRQMEARAWHGYEVVRGAAPPGADTLDFWLDVVFTTSLTQRYTILTGARAWSSERALIGHDPMSISGEGYLSRFAGVKITVYRKEVGTPLYHGQIIKALLLLAGIPAARIAIADDLGYQLEAHYERSCVEGVAEAQAVAESAGYILGEDGDGLIVARHIAPVHLAPVAEINIEVLETGEITANIQADTQDVPTTIRVTGNRPELPDALEGFVSERKLESEVIEPYTVPQTWSQSAAGAVTSLRAELTENRITSQVWVTNVFYQGCLVRTVREVWGQKNPEVWRYETESPATLDGTPFSYRTSGTTGFIYGAGVTKDDSAVMRRWFDFQLAPITVETVEYIRNSADTYSGALIQTIQSTAEWGTLEAAWKAKTLPGNTFDEEVVRAALRFFGGGRVAAGLGGASEAAGFAEELWFEGPGAPTVSLGQTAGMGSALAGGGNAALPGEPIDMQKLAKYRSQVVTDIDLALIDTGTGRDAGHVSREVSVETGYGWANDGDQYQTKGGTITGDPTQSGDGVKTTNKNYVNDGEATHTQIETRFDGDGAFISSESRPGQPSALPNADICTPETEALKANVPVVGLCTLVSADYTTREEVASFDFGVEDEGAAAELACVLLREASAFTVQLSLPISAIFWAKAPVIFRAVHKGIDPTAYLAAGHLSNAWVDDVEIASVRDGGEVKRVLSMTLRLPII